MAARILIVDDSYDFAIDLKNNLELRLKRASGIVVPEIVIFNDPDRVKDEVRRKRLRQRLICVLDHDLGGGAVGVELADWLVAEHPLGRANRFVYLTGRLPVEEFERDRRTRFGPIDHFFVKDASPDLLEVVVQLEAQLRAEEAVDGATG